MGQKQHGENPRRIIGDRTIFGKHIGEKRMEGWEMDMCMVRYHGFIGTFGLAEGEWDKDIELNACD